MSAQQSKKLKTTPKEKTAEIVKETAPAVATAEENFGPLLVQKLEVRKFADFLLYHVQSCF